MRVQQETGTVVEFNERVGLGVIETLAGNRYTFHCTQIVDGSRTIELATAVTFVVVPRHKGILEAYSVTKR